MIISGQDSGNGYPLVLLHGFCEDHTMWDGFLASLSLSNRVLCPDLPGFGKSPILPETSIESVAAAIYDWLKSKDIFECTMIGHSLGGYITLAIEEAYPQFLKSFGLFHSTALADTEEKKIARNKTIESIKVYGKDPFLKTFVPSLYNQDRLVEYSGSLEKSFKMSQSCSSEALIAYTEAMRERKDRFQIIQASSKPVLFIAGEKDNAIAIDKSILHQPYIKPEHFHILKDVGHMGFYEEPQKSLAFIRVFLTRSEA